MKIIAVSNQKGGVGKTTTCVNLTCALREAGKRVLLCDLDPQGNATSGMGIDKSAASPGIYEVLVSGAEVKSAVRKTRFGDVLPANSGLAGAGIELVSIQWEYYALEGLSDLMLSIRLTKRSFNPDIRVEGVLLTMYDSRTNFSAQVASEVKRYFKDKVYGVVIPRNVRIAEAPSHGQPVLTYDRQSRGAAAYRQLAAELIAKNS